MDASGEANIYDSARSPTTETISISHLLSRWDGAAISVSRDGRITLPNYLAFIRFLTFLPLVLLGITGYVSGCHAGTEQHKDGIRTYTTECGGAFVVAAAVIFVANFREVGFMMNGDTVRSVAKANVGHFFGSESYEGVCRAIGSEDTVLIDARSRKDYETETIPRSVNLPLSASSNSVYAFAAAHAKDVKLIVFCNSSVCPYAAEMASKLESVGFRDIAIYRSGWVDWKERSTSIEIDRNE